MIRDIARLEHILESIDVLERVIARGVKEFMEDDIIQAAALHKLQVIGEAVKQLSSELKNANPDVKWRRYTGLRDFLIHVYFGVLLERVWDFMAEDIAPLKQRVKEILAGLVE